MEASARGTAARGGRDGAVRARLGAGGMVGGKIRVRGTRTPSEMRPVARAEARLVEYVADP
jgi:hypothetical protein